MKQIYYHHKRVFSFFFFSALFMVVFQGCDEFESDQEVPAYIKINSLGLVTEYDVEGTASHNITDAWVIVNERLIGAFELPAMVPVLANGLCNVEILAGIKQNGVSSTRIPYPFYAPLVVENVRLTPDSITTIAGNVSYYANTEFAWKEDFESNLTIEEQSQSDTAIIRTSEISDVFQGNYSGRITLTALENFYLGYMKDAAQLPKLNSPVYLEMNYKIEEMLVIGMYSQVTGSILKEDVLVLNTTDTWKKIYINFTPLVNRYSGSYDFKVFLESTLSTGSDQAVILLDNIKLVHRETSSDE